MFSTFRLLLFPALFGFALAGLNLYATSTANAATPRVIIVDNDAPVPSQGIDHRTGEWTFSPNHIAVLKGESIVFDNPAGNFRPHNVVSISLAGSANPPNVESGAKFTTGTARDNWLQPGGSWTMDTGNIDPGHYSYYCSLHPWVVGSVSVLAP